MIGVLDSGIGGLSVLKAIAAQIPSQDVLYVADQAHLPYGPRPLADVQNLTQAIAHTLIQKGADVVVIACNTASAAALHHLRRVFPATPFVGMEPAIRPAARDTQSGVIGVIATEATFQGQLYASLLDRFAAGVTVVKRACPEFVLMAERGAPWTDDDYAEARRILADFRAAGADQLVLGCTHFAFLKDPIGAALGEAVTIVDPAPAIARQTERVINDLNLPPENGTITLLTSGDPQRFAEQVRALMGDNFRGTVGRFLDEGH